MREPAQGVPLVIPLLSKQNYHLTLISMLSMIYFTIVFNTNHLFSPFPSITESTIPPGEMAMLETSRQMCIS